MSRRGVPIGSFLIVLGLLLGCARGVEPPAPRIVLEPAEREGHWRVTYELGRPARALLFQRPAGMYREQVWRVQTPGWRFARSGEHQLLLNDEIDESAGADRVVVEFPVHTATLPKEYELFSRFTDGSVAIYTGHLYAAVVEHAAMADEGGTASEVHDEASFLRRIELVPPSGERLVVRGVVSHERKLWEDPHEDGSCVYFGTIPPLETESMVAVLDPGAPAWLLEQLHALLPRTFELYDSRFGESLPWKPVVLFGFENDESSGLASGGGTLDGLVQMRASGRGWHEATPDSAEQLLYLIAHEAAHFWNGQLHPYRDAADSWMHEGSADAFAGLALAEAGYIGPERLAERRTQALEECAVGLSAGSLKTSGERGQFRNYYSCGEIIAAWSMAAVADPVDPETLFAIWRRIFERSAPEDGGYDRQTYFEALASLDVQPESLEALERFIDREHEDPAAELVGLFRRVGFELETPERPLPGSRRAHARAAVRHLMADVCQGRFSFHDEPPVFRTAALDDCAPFVDELRIVAIAGHEVGPAGDLAFEAMRGRCDHDEAVTLTLEGGSEVQVPCSTPPAPRPTPLVFPVVRDSPHR